MKKWVRTHLEKVNEAEKQLLSSGDNADSDSYVEQISDPTYRLKKLCLQEIKELAKRPRKYDKRFNPEQSDKKKFERLQASVYAMILLGDRPYTYGELWSKFWSSFKGDRELFLECMENLVQREMLYKFEVYGRLKYSVNPYPGRKDPFPVKEPRQRRERQAKVTIVKTNEPPKTIEEQMAELPEAISHLLGEAHKSMAQKEATTEAIKYVSEGTKITIGEVTIERDPSTDMKDTDAEEWG